MYLYRGSAPPALDQGGAATAAPAAAAAKGGSGGTSGAAAAARKKRKQPGSEAAAPGKGRAATATETAGAAAAVLAGGSAPSPLGSGGCPELELVLEQVPKWQLLLDVLGEAQDRRGTWGEEAKHRQSLPKSEGGEGRRSVAATTLGDDGDRQGSDGDSDVVEVAAPGAGTGEHGSGDGGGGSGDGGRGGGDRGRGGGNSSGDGSEKAHQSWDGGWWMARVIMIRLGAWLMHGSDIDCTCMQPPTAPAAPMCLAHPVLSAPLPLSTPPATSLVAAGHSPVVVVVTICSSCTGMRLPHPRPHPPATSAASLAASGTSAVLVVAREPHMCLQLEQVVRLGGEAVMQVCMGWGVGCLGSEEAWRKEGKTHPSPSLHGLDASLSQ